MLEYGSVISVKGGSATTISYNNGMPITDAVAVSNGSYSNNFCFAREDGSMHCGSSGQANPVAAYTPASPSKAVISLSTSNIGGGVCALLADKTVACGGSGGLSPQSTGTSEPIVQLACFRDDACCGVTEGGEVQCWGENATPTNGPDAKALMVVGSDLNQCAVYDDGKAYCWGAAWSGQTGGSPEQSNPIAPVPLTDAVVGAAGGQFHNCWVHDNGSISCSGNGGGTSNGAGGGAAMPTKIRASGGALLENIIAVNGGRGAACGAARSGDLYCWGDAGGQAETAVRIDLGGEAVRMPQKCM